MATEPSNDRSRLLTRFPALRRIGDRRRRIPFVQQLSANECGAACLGMVLSYHGRDVPLEDLRNAFAVGRGGVSALGLLNAARVFGLRGRGVRVDIDRLGLLQSGAVLHWEFNHFVVLERITKQGVHVIDPAFGRRRIPHEQVRKAFTGVAIEFERTDTFTAESTSRSSLWPVISSVLGRSGLLPRILVTSLLVQLFTLSVPIFTGQLVDHVAPRGDNHLLAVLVIGVATMVAFNLVANLIRSNLLLHLRTLADAKMILGFLDHLVALPFSFFQSRSAGDLMMRLNSNTTVREILTSGLLAGLLDGALVLFYLALMFIVSPLMATVALAIGLVKLGILLSVQRRHQDLATESLQVEARSHAYQVEMLTGIETLKAMGCEHRAVSRWSNLFAHVLNVSVARGRLDAVVESIVSALRLAAPLAILTCGTVLVMRGALTLGTMLAVTALGSAFLTPLFTLLACAMQLQMMRSYLERINDVLQTAPEQPDTRSRRTAKISGQISLRHVSFRYEPSSPYVVQDASIDIQAGQFVALVGPSGAGKSTLAALLLGMHRPTSGHIHYDNVDLAEFHLQSLRQQVGTVIQNTDLFAGSIRDNIALAHPELPASCIEEAARLANIHDEIVAMPQGYQTPLVDRGASISGGQRQRIALARAVVGRPAILLLDEATSALDAVSESRVQRAIAELNCTRIVIAHRLSTIRAADLILVIDEGRIVESGTHDELLCRRGFYQRLIALQSQSP